MCIYYDTIDNEDKILSNKILRTGEPGRMEERMNRFKKELRKKGIKMENDYNYLPCEYGNNLVLEGISVSADYAKFILHFTCGSVWYKMDRKR